LYAAHRIRRNAQQKDKFLDADFKELIIDPYLLRLTDPRVEPGFKDTRYCMTFWGRPPIHVLELAYVIQKKLKDVAPSKSNPKTNQVSMQSSEGDICSRQYRSVIAQIQDIWNILDF
jgi:hypothetical protein